MHQTTVRFSPDVWEALELECASLGISAAQFLREAALARINYAAGRRGVPEYEVALARAVAAEHAERPHHPRTEHLPIGELVARNIPNLAAVGAQGDLARRRSQQLRDESRALRARRRQEG